MRDCIVGIKLKIISIIYRIIIKPILFLIPPETAHNFIIKFGQFCSQYNIIQRIIRIVFNYQNPKLKQTILGINFENPIGLAAGFDKNAVLIDIISEIGFGYSEVGSITGQPQKGNPKPRLWRLPKSHALVVNYGLKNAGAEIISKKISNKKFHIPVGINIAGINNKDDEDNKVIINDYLKAVSAFKNIGNYYSINISCPSNIDNQSFISPESLDRLLNNIDNIVTHKPVFIKLPPDLNHMQIDKIIKVSNKHNVSGFICSNLIKSDSSRINKGKILDQYHPSKGGISGKVIEDLTNQLIAYIYQKTKGHYIIIGCGGVFSAKDAYRKIKLGASLIQLVTGIIYQGPQLISEINLGLIKLLQQDNLDNIHQAIGKDIH